ncbi:MAG: WG repeat-containing protein [Oscillospiraceae bacterium]
MKRLTLIMFAMLLLTACAQIKSPTPTPTPLPTFTETTGIYADWSKLTKPVQPADVGTRLTEGELTSLTPSDSYGPLMPYIGGELTAEEMGSAWLNYQYGLVTLDGCVVLDPVLDSVYIISKDSAYAFILGRHHQVDGAMVERYALCASDGSWCTDFLYSDIFSYDDGLIRLLDVRYDADGNFTGDMENSCLMDFDGNVVLNFSGISPEMVTDPEDKASLQYDFAGYSDGFVRLMSEGRYVYIDAAGKLLRSDEFDGYCASANAFSNGRAIVQLEKNGLWGVLGTDGRWLIEPKFAELDWYNNGAAIAKTTDGRTLAVDEDGNKIADISAIENASVMGLGKGIIITSWDDNGQFTCFDKNLNDLGATGYPLLLNGSAVFLTQEGIAIFDGENTRYLPGEYQMLDCYNGCIVAVTMGQEGRLMDSDGNVLITLPDCEYGAACKKDRITGAYYLVRWNDSSLTVRSESGDTLTVPSAGDDNLYDGKISVTDETGAGVMDLKGDYIFRVSVDFTD